MMINDFETLPAEIPENSLIKLREESEKGNIDAIKALSELGDKYRYDQLLRNMDDDELSC